MPSKRLLEEYARLIVRIGGKVNKGEIVWINAQLDQPEFIEMVVEECYKCGAKLVDVDWRSDRVAKTQYKKASVKALSEFPTWKEEKQKFSCDKRTH